jgi:thiamine phosphate synthase YjbQ (UPF0047 family)
MGTRLNYKSGDMLMAVVTKEIEINTKGFNDIHDITPLIADFVKKLPFSEGSVVIFIPGSTA